MLVHTNDTTMEEVWKGSSESREGKEDWNVEKLCCRSEQDIGIHLALPVLVVAPVGHLVFFGLFPTSC